MEVNQETLEKLMRMAYLELEPGEKASMYNDLNRIMLWMKQLQELDVTGVEPLLTMSSEVNQLSDDAPEPPLPVTQVFVNAPQHDQAYFIIPAKGMTKDEVKSDE